MATIVNLETGARVVLVSYHTFGRHSETSHTTLANNDASRFHAVICWDGCYWRLINKGVNGTYLNQVKIVDKAHDHIKANDIIQFGNQDSDIWQVLDTHAPQNMLIPLTADMETIILDGVVAIPSEEFPEILIYLSSDGTWVCETESGVSRLQSGDLLGSAESLWRFTDAKPSLNTQDIEERIISSRPTVGMYFMVSQNEEHVSIKLTINQETIDLEERTHHYLVLVLARRCLEDKRKNVARTERGWIDKDELSNMLGLSNNHINIQIHRFRKQCLTLLPESMRLHQLIERRAGELRLDCDAIQIDGGLHDDVQNTSYSAS